MKLFIAFLSVLVLNIQTLDLETVRKDYKKAANDKTKVDAFEASLSNVAKQSSVELIAYKGAAVALKAKYAKTIKEKKSGFIEGVTWVEYAIEKSPNNIETRFIRLGIQENTPKLLKYKDNIQEDKLFILKQFMYIKSSNLKTHIKDFIKQSSVFSEEEKNSVN